MNVRAARKYLRAADSNRAWLIADAALREMRRTNADLSQPDVAKALENVKREAQKVIDKQNPMNHSNPAPLEGVPEIVKRGVFELKTYKKLSSWYLTDEKTRKSVDAWLVGIKHPLAYQPGTMERRYHAIVRELAGISNPMNWSKARDWEVLEGARSGWPEAIAEAKRRGLEVKPSSKAKGAYWSKKNPTAPSLYEAFHGNPPHTSRKLAVRWPNAGEPMLAIGKLIEVRYKPYGSSKRSNTIFFHKLGDDGERVAPDKPILATTADGKGLFILSDKADPTFTERGIIGALVPMILFGLSSIGLGTHVIENLI